MNELLTSTLSDRDHIRRSIGVTHHSGRGRRRIGGRGGAGRGSAHPQLNKTAELTEQNNTDEDYGGGPDSAKQLVSV